MRPPRLLFASFSLAAALPLRASKPVPVPLDNPSFETFFLAPGSYRAGDIAFHGRPGN
jgi:hypothetical protein